ncbi:MAG: hypothetical protein QOK02_4523 [Mycobacterium sp.]|jgi:steroid delta-isomerase-like uncharacterized protein|nr:hypothetical protein [Mycobacterium sp.]
MDVNRNKDLLRRFYDELWTQGNVDVIPELVADDYIDHQSPPGLPAGPRGLADLIRSWKRGFPDGSEEPDALIAEDDLVVGRFTFRGTHLGEFMGVSPTGRSVVMTGIDVVRIRDGKITEFWYSEQLHDLLQQLGALPPQIADGAT